MKSFILIVFFLNVSCVFAQPGPFGADLIFTLRDLEPRNTYQVMWHDERSKSTRTIQANKGEYRILGVKTPVGGGVDGYIIIACKGDTMIIHPPFSSSENIVIRNIPFRRGKYLIPYVVYYTQKLFKPKFRKKLALNLEGDWFEFEIGTKNPVQTVVLRRVELFKNSELISLLLPSFCDDNSIFSDNPYYLKDYFIQEGFYKKIIGNGFYIPRHFKYYFFGILRGTNIYFLQREEDSLLECGTLEIPIERNIQEKREDCPKGLLYPNLNKEIHFDTYSYKNGNIPTVIGYYHGVKKCDESFGTVKPMWGIFDIYIDKPDSLTIELIKKEHNFDNNLIDKK